MPQRGNILFLILLAVVLFAALSYAVTSSMRGGGKDVTDENAESGAAAILNYMTMVRSEVQRLMLVNDCKVENIDWRDGLYRTKGEVLITDYPALSPKTGCAVFQAQGGAIAPQEFSRYQTTAYDAVGPSFSKAGHFTVSWVNMTNQGTTRNDVGFWVHGLTPPVCLAAAKKINPSLTSLTSDAHSNSNKLDVAEPAAYTGGSALIGNVTQNNNFEGLYFAQLAGGYCLIGMILIPQ